MRRLIRYSIVLAALSYVTLGATAVRCSTCADNIYTCTGCCTSWATCCTQHGGTPNINNCQFSVQGGSNICNGPACDGADTEPCNPIGG